MSLMEYDAATIGNHDFDNGVEALAAVSKFASFPLINANYEFKETAMENKTVPYRIFEKSGIRIGVFGLGIKLDGLVPKYLSGKTEYTDPVQKAQYWSSYLKSRKRCHLVICLSHLGFEYNDKRISDTILAENCSDLDLILGGHTHTFLDEPIKVKHANGHQVLIAQSGWAGLRLGRIDYHFRSGTDMTDSITYLVKDF
jgi:5'-nucleotidase